MVRKKQKEEVELQSVAQTLSNIFSDTDKIVPAPRWFLHSGNLAIDYILSQKVDCTGGYPNGIVELHGDPATGKSLLFALAIAEAQRRGLNTILADAEGRWDYDFSELHGVNSDLLRANTFYPETVEEFVVKALEILEQLGKVVLILDSMAILSTIQEREDAEEGSLKSDMGKKAAKIKMGMRVLSSEVRKTGSLFLISNHMIAQQNMYVPKTTPGGGGVPFQANIRAELTKPTPIKVEKKLHPIGVQLHLECTKNSVVPPFGSCDIDLYFNSGIDLYSGLIDIAKDIGVVKQSGGYYYYKEKSFRSSDFKELCKTTELLKEGAWTKPYWATNG